jgi:uncharacterized membrane protein YGL010W
MIAAMRPSLVRLFEEYAESHRHPMNRLTHKVAIPLIVFHVIAMLTWIPLFTIPSTSFVVTAGHTSALFAIGWYLFMSPKLGALMALGFAACFPLAAVTPPVVVIAIAVFAWIVQLAGHFVWEKNSPAFLRNMVQTLVGPIFFVAILTGDWPSASAARATTA